MGNKKLVPPEDYYGEDKYYNILFFTLGKEKANLWMKECKFYNTARGKALKKLKKLQEVRKQKEEINEAEMQRLLERGKNDKNWRGLG